MMLSVNHCNIKKG